jgi:hypothetical protein
MRPERGGGRSENRLALICGREEVTMRRVLFVLPAAWVLLLVCPTAAWAGMPSPHLSDWAELRFEAISFFVVVLLAVAAAVRWLWNSLAKDFPKLPRLSYRRALAAAMLGGLVLVVVLTMIAGSRELLTPGAWQKQGVLYKVHVEKTP